MQLHLTEDSEGVLLPAAALDHLLDADETDLRVLAYALLCAAEGKTFDENDTAAALSIPVGDAKSAIKLWKGAKVFTQGAAAPKTKSDKPKRAPAQKHTTQYTSEELVRIADGNPAFADLLKSAQETVGEIFNQSKIEIIAALYADLRLAPEYILALLNYFVCKREKSLRYVETVAYSMIDEGISTPEALEERLRYLEQFEGRAGKIRKMFGIGGRKLSEKEETAINDWFDLYGFDDDVIAMAYEKTVDATGKASISYANSILRAWHEAGIKDADGVKAYTEDKGKKTAKSAAQSYDVNEFFSKALARSYGETEKKDV